MKKALIVSIVAICMVISTADISSARIARVEKAFNFLEFYVSGSMPVGEYERIGVGDYEIPFYNSQGRLFDLDADEVYKDAVSFGVKYGRLQGERWSYSLGLEYTTVKHEDTFYVDDLIHMYNDEFEQPDIRLYDLAIDVNFHFANPHKAPFSPFVGVGFNGGILYESVESSNEIVYGLGLNFGADVTVWKDPSNRSFVTLSSVNKYQLLADKNRPRYLQIGGAVKYFFSY